MGEPTIDDLIGHDRLYDFSYKYGENAVGGRSKVFAANTWPLPNSESYLIEKLNRDWVHKKVPLHISMKDGRVLIVHKTYPSTGKIAQLQLDGNLAYTLGYTHEGRESGQYLRFDEIGEYHAPYEPKSFGCYIDKNMKRTLEMLRIDSQLVDNVYQDKVPAQRRLLQVMLDIILKISALKEKSKQEHRKELLAVQAKNDEKWNEILDRLESHDYEMVACQVGKEDAINDLRRFYEMRMNELRLEHASFLDESVLQYEKYIEEIEYELENGRKDLNAMLEKSGILGDQGEELSDCRDRVLNNVTAIVNFDEELTLDRWKLKGIVVRGEEVDAGFDEIIYVMTMKDPSGEIDISAFGEHGRVLKSLSVVGKEFYVEKTEDLRNENLYQRENVDRNVGLMGELRVSIRNNSFRVKFEEVN